MKMYYARTPEDYEEFFHRQMGMRRLEHAEQENLWEHPQNGCIINSGSRGQIQFSIGSYTVPEDFCVEYGYDTRYLHLGIIYEGTTYSLVEDKLKASAAPSAFLAVENECGGVNCWKKGQHLKGIEMSVDMIYLKEVILPFLGLEKDALSFLEENVRYTLLPDEIRNLIFRAEQMIRDGSFTAPLRISLCLEFIAHLLHPDNRNIFTCGETDFCKYISVGKSRVKITSEDFKKIVEAHNRIEKDASSFFTIYELSRELGISEQKLKAGFKELYRQTLWDYANSVRMHTAVMLLQNTDMRISEISQRVGYQSQVAFSNMFKKWCGLTPGQFRIQSISCDGVPWE